MVYFISQFGITFSSWEEVTAAGVETAGQIASVSTAERMNASMLVLSQLALLFSPLGNSKIFHCLKLLRNVMFVSKLMLVVDGENP